MALSAAGSSSIASIPPRLLAASPIVTKQGLENVDGKLRHLIAKATNSPEYWSFAAVRNGYSHCYFRYPAMMVAEMQRHLISMVLELQPNVQTLADPFAGSGTVLLEAMFRGLDAYAYDVNPLAILLCKSKTVLCKPSELREAARCVILRATNDRRKKIEADFKGLDKWFSKVAANELSALRRAIREIQSVHVRRFLWVALAETVRQTSRSRTSTYKLHIRPEEERRRLPRPLTKFAEVVERNIGLHRRTRQRLDRLKLVKGSRYGRRIDIALHDARRAFSKQFDLIVTSPPYGDNQSTVPYGQNSYLPLQWIDLADIDGRVSKECLRTTYEIDNLSLGGRLPHRVVRQTVKEILKASPSLARLIGKIPREPADRRRRILTFVQDMDASLKAIAGAANSNAYLVFTLGNRRVANKSVPLDCIVGELLRHYRVKQILSITRKIPSKRMATRNSIASTIRKEQIAIFRKIPS
jgi:tRNA G10  N-methylase Trm11